MNVMLLAAGEGTRLRPFTLEQPKPAIPFLTAPLAAYSLQLLADLKIHNLAVNVHHLPHHVRDLIKDLKPPAQHIHFSDETTGLLGSGGGIHHAKKFLMGRENFLVMNADEVILPKTPNLIQEFIKFHESHRGIATLMTMNHPEVGKQFGGAWTLNGQDEIKLFSKTSPGREYVGHHFIGAMLLNDRIFHYFKNQVEVENILYETLTNAMKHQEKVYSFEVDCEWQETGNPQDFLSATKFFSKMILEKPQTLPAQFLTETIRRYSGRNYMLEKTDAEALSLLHQVLDQLEIEI